METNLAGDYNIKWANHHRSLVRVMENLLADETYADCSLAADGVEISAHKLILSACSPFLNKLLCKHREKHPVIVLRDVSSQDLQSIVAYVYRGEVQLPQQRLSSFLRAAESLQLTGIFPGDFDVEENVINEIKMDENMIDEIEEVLEEEEEEEDPVAIAVAAVTTAGSAKSYPPVPSTLTDQSKHKIISQPNPDDSMMEPLVEYLSESSEAEGEDEDVRVEVAEDEEIEEKWLISGTEAEGENEEESVEIEFGSILAAPATTTPILHQEADNKYDAQTLQVPITLPHSIFSTQTPSEEDELANKFATVKLKSTRHQGEEYTFNCKRCNGLYKTQSTFFNHLRHDCNQFHTCSQCGKMFKNKRHLLDHVRDDCGRVHICPRCSRCFKQKVNLTTHQKHYCKPRQSSQSQGSPIYLRTPKKSAK